MGLQKAGWGGIVDASSASAPTANDRCKTCKWRDALCANGFCVMAQIKQAEMNPARAAWHKEECNGCNS